MDPDDVTAATRLVAIMHATGRDVGIISLDNYDWPVDEWLDVLVLIASILEESDQRDNQLVHADLTRLQHIITKRVRHKAKSVKYDNEGTDQPF